MKAIDMKLKNYETIFALTPVLSEEQLKDSISKFRNFLQEKQAEIIHEEKIGLKKLAYPIQRKSTGMYQLFEFKATPDVVHSLEIEYRRDEKVIRFLTFALDKHAVEYNMRKRTDHAQRDEGQEKKTESKQAIA